MHNRRRMHVGQHRTRANAHNHGHTVLTYEDSDHGAGRNALLDSATGDFNQHHSAVASGRRRRHCPVQVPRRATERRSVSGHDKSYPKTVGLTRPCKRNNEVTFSCYQRHNVTSAISLLSNRGYNRKLRAGVRWSVLRAMHGSHEAHMLVPITEFPGVRLAKALE
jgi:hypothetical protein